MFPPVKKAPAVPAKSVAAASTQTNTGSSLQTRTEESTRYLAGPPVKRATSAATTPSKWHHLPPLKPPVTELLDTKLLNLAQQELFFRILHANNPVAQPDAKSLIEWRQTEIERKQYHCNLFDIPSERVLREFMQGNHEGLSSILVTSVLFANIDLRCEDLIVRVTGKGRWIYSLESCERVMVEEWKRPGTTVYLGMNAATFNNLPLSCWENTEELVEDEEIQSRNVPFRGLQWLDNRIGGVMVRSNRFPPDAAKQAKFCQQKLQDMLLNALRPLALYQAHARLAAGSSIAIQTKLFKFCSDMLAKYHFSLLSNTQFKEFFLQEYAKFQQSTTGVIPVMLQALVKEAATLGVGAGLEAEIWKGPKILYTEYTNYKRPETVFNIRSQDSEYLSDHLNNEEKPMTILNLMTTWSKTAYEPKVSATTETVSEASSVASTMPNL